MSREHRNHRLRQASVAWSRLFQSTNPRENRTRTTFETTPIPSNHHSSQTRTQQTIAITQENLTHNTPWGDKIDTIRIYTQNLNGMKIQLDGGQYKDM